MFETRSFRRVRCLVVAIVFCLPCTLNADGATTSVGFGEGENAFELEFVFVGDPGNPNDVDIRTYPHEMGGVDYTYHIAKYEVSCDEFSKAVVSGGFFNETQPCDASPVRLPFDLVVSFVNWLNTSWGFHAAYVRPDTQGFPVKWQPDDPGFDSDNPFRNSLSRFALAEADEWHKAAYYEPVSQEYYLYATGSNQRPTPVTEGTEAGTAVLATPVNGVDFKNLPSVRKAGGLSPYGTMAQTGNADEWEEGLFWEGTGPQSPYRSGFDPFDQLNAKRSRQKHGGGLARGVRLVMVGVDPVVDCNRSGLVDAGDLNCSNTFGTTRDVLDELGLVSGDLNADGTVSFGDFLVLATNFNQELGQYTDGDIDNDGQVSLPDFLILAANFGSVRRLGTEAVPEPSSLTLLVLGLLGVTRRRSSNCSSC